jgi:hypothetical protein
MLFLSQMKNHYESKIGEPVIKFVRRTKFVFNNKTVLGAITLDGGGPFGGA